MRTEIFAILFLLIFVFPNRSEAQILSPYFTQDSLTQIGIYSGLVANSNSINNDIFKKFIFGGTISDSSKNISQGRLKKKNRLGADFSQQIFVKLPFDSLFGKKGYALVFGLKNTTHFDAGFAKGAFDLAFYGNTAYKDTTLNFDKTNFTSLKYQQFQFGFIKSEKREKRILQEGIIFSFVKAQQYQSLFLKKGSLYTSGKNNDLDMAADFDYFSSDTARTGMGAFNGYGFSANVFMDFAIGKKGKFHIEFDDLGFLTFNKKSLYTSGDTSISFQGVNINNVIAGNDSLFANLNGDSLQNTVVQRKEKSALSVSLPAWVKVYYTTHINSQLQFWAGAKYRIQSNYFPYIYAKLDYWLDKNVGFYFQFAYGGYGNLAAGLGVMTYLSKRLTFFAATNNLEFLSGKYNRGISGFAGLNYYFK